MPRSPSRRPSGSTGRCSSTRSSAATSGSAGAAATSARRHHASATRASGSRTSTSSSSSITARPSTGRSRAARSSLGSDVIVVHRLLKNEVVEKLGIHAYALISQACIDASDLDPAALGMREHTETYDRIGDVPAWVHDLERRWQEEEARERVFVSPEESIVNVSVPNERAAAGGLGVPHEAGAADDLAALGDGGRGHWGDRRPARPRLGQPLHARQGRRGRGDPRLAPVRLRHRSDDPRDPRPDR